MSQEKVVLIKGAAQKRLEAVTADQNRVNEGLRALYDKYKQKLNMLETPHDLREWAGELGVEDVDWFYGEVLMMVHPSFVPIGPELYNHLCSFMHAFKERDSWYGLHLKIGTQEKG